MKSESNYPNNSITIDFLVTTVGKTQDEIVSIVLKDGLYGNVIVGNQRACDESVCTFKMDNLVLTIVNMQSIGTSKNRNTLLKYSKSMYVTFWDDDAILFPEFKGSLSAFLAKAEKYDAVRFNTKSDNNERPIKIIKKSKKISFWELKSFGVLGVFFKRDILLKQKLIFNERIGPGTEIDHGEDTVFLRSFLRNNNIFQFNNIIMHISQDDSCWFQQDKSLKYYFSQGYVYYLLFGYHSRFFAFLYMLKSRDGFRSKKNKSECWQSLVKGIKKAKKEK